MISVIVPVYNAQNALNKCVDSILAQTYREFELILVDDGSTDASAEVCDRYAESDSRVKVVHQQNAGVAAARNSGLEAAGGEYLSFVDSDDYVEPDYLECMLDGIRHPGVDICWCDNCDEAPDGTVIGRADASGNEFLTAADFDWNGGSQHGDVVWACLFDRTLIDGLRFAPDLSVGEDSLFFAQCLGRSQGIRRIKKVLYHYVVRDDSAFHGGFSPRKLDELRAWWRICRLYGWRDDVRAAYALRCQNIIARYFDSPEFRRTYLRKVIHEQRRNAGPLFRYYAARRDAKMLFVTLLYTVAPCAYRTVHR